MGWKNYLAIIDKNLIVGSKLFLELKIKILYLRLDYLPKILFFDKFKSTKDSDGDIFFYCNTDTSENHMFKFFKNYPLVYS